MKFIVAKWVSMILSLMVIGFFVTGTALGEEVLRHTLLNGLQVVIVRNTLAPVVTTEVNYLAVAIHAEP